MLDVMFIGIQVVLFVVSVYALKVFLLGQGKFTGRND